jgi:hypothetical protein
MVRLAKAADADHGLALAAIMRERGCSPDEANRILRDRQLKDRQTKLQSFTDELNSDVETIERAAKKMPHRQRELMMDLPWRQGLAMAVRHFAPRQRGRCERRPRVRALPRRRSSRSTRAGPSSDPDEPEPPRRRRHLRRLHNGHEPRAGPVAQCCSNDPGRWSGQREERR